MAGLRDHFTYRDEYGELRTIVRDTQKDASINPYIVQDIILSAERDKAILRAAAAKFLELLSEIKAGSTISVKSMNDTYLPQLDKKRIDSLHRELHEIIENYVSIC